MITIQNLSLTVVSSEDCGELHIEQSVGAFKLKTHFPQNPDCSMIVLSHAELLELANIVQEVVKLTKQYS